MLAIVGNYGNNERGVKGAKMFHSVRVPDGMARRTSGFDESSLHTLSPNGPCHTQPSEEKG